MFKKPVTIRVVTEERGTGRTTVMTSSLLMPRGGVRAGAAGRGTAGGATATGDAGSVAPTPILDWRHPDVASLVRRIGISGHSGDASDPAHRTAALRRAHRHIAAEVRPVYSVQDTRPVSQVLRRGRG